MTGRLLAAGGVGLTLFVGLGVFVVLAIIFSQVVSQGLVSLSKGLFARARPDVWLDRHEPGFSYPSGHATTAVVFYGAWVVVLWTSPLPAAVRVCGTALLAGWALGIGWSRIALGAHYPTDVIGGFLLGAAWFCFALAAGRSAGLVTLSA